MSPSSRGRGLKWKYRKKTTLEILVAPFTRAWIEIPVTVVYNGGKDVALFTRAWIEM